MDVHVISAMAGGMPEAMADWAARVAGMDRGRAAYSVAAGTCAVGV